MHHHHRNQLMSDITLQFHDATAHLAARFNEWAAHFSKHPFLESFTLQQLPPALGDLKTAVAKLGVSPTVATIVVVSVTFLLLSSGYSLLRSKAEKSSAPKKKKLTKAQKANKEIQAVLDHVEDVYVPQIDGYLQKFDSLSADDQQYKFKYFDEMLLKELMKLDGVDVAGNDVLRENRKKVIQFIQQHQKRLDEFKKDKLN